jgi:hypothetical protein
MGVQELEYKEQQEAKPNGAIQVDPVTPVVPYEFYQGIFGHRFCF